MIMIIRKLKRIGKNEFDGLGHNGYTSEKRYAVDRKTGLFFLIALQVKDVQETVGNGGEH